MGSISEYQFRQLLQRTKRAEFGVAADACEDESQLHADIITHCKNNGWLYFHGSMAHRTHRTKGEFDFTIFADRGRVFVIEGKSKMGKLSTDQLGVIAWAKQLGHEARFHVVSSYAQFLEAVK